MSYQIIPNVIFIVSVAGMIVIILRVLPTAISDAREKKEDARADEKLQDKGLPALGIPHLRSVLKLWGKKLLNFIMEAKDLAPGAVAGYKIKKIFRGKLPAAMFGAQESPAEEKAETGPKLDEEHYLHLIKNEPKNLEHYYSLGRLYVSEEKFQDAADIFEYLASHEPTNPEYHSKKALCYYKLKSYDKAIGSYEQAIALDNTQPNRYYNLGVSSEAAGDFAKASAAFSQAIALEPGNGKYHIALGMLQAKQGDRQAAIQTLRAGRQHDPNNLELVEKLNALMK